MTEINFGLRSAGNGRLARHGRPGQGSTYLRTAIPRQATDTIAPQGLPRCQGGLQPARSPRQATDTLAPQGLSRAQGGLQPARATPRPRRRASPWKLEEYTDRHGYDGSARMLMSFVWNSLDLPCRARRPLSATCAAPSNRPYERCAPYLRVSTPPCEPVRRTLRAQRCPSIARSALK